jgi:hypothetical protein
MVSFLMAVANTSQSQVRSEDTSLKAVIWLRLLDYGARNRKISAKAWMTNAKVVFLKSGSSFRTNAMDVS